MTTGEGATNPNTRAKSLVNGLCPECGAPYHVELAAGEQQVTCPSGHTFYIDRSAEEVGEGYDLVEAPDSAPPVAQKPRLSIPCIQHADVMAVAQCSQCGAGVCEICDFAYPGGVHLCPNCASNPVIKLSPKRKSLAVWSIVLAFLSTASLCCAFVMYMILADDPEMAGVFDMLFSWGTLVLALTGLGLGVSSRSKQSGNTAITYVGWIWCTIMLCIYGLLIIAGIFAGG